MKAIILLCCATVEYENQSSGTEARSTASKTALYIDICFDHKGKETYFSAELQLTTDANAKIYQECLCIVNNAIFSLQINKDVTVDQCSVAKLQINSDFQLCDNQQDKIELERMSNAYISLTLEANYTEEHMIWVTIKPKGNATIFCSVTLRQPDITSQTSTVYTTPETFPTTGKGNAKISKSISPMQPIINSTEGRVSTTPRIYAITTDSIYICMIGLAVFVLILLLVIGRFKYESMIRRCNRNERPRHVSNDARHGTEDQLCEVSDNVSNQALDDSAYETMDTLDALRRTDESSHGLLTCESNV